MEENNVSKNQGSNKRLIILLIILVVLVAGLLVYKYVFMNRGNNNNNNNELNNNQEEVAKISEEEVKKIYDTILYKGINDYSYGLYFKEKVDSSNVMPFVVLALKNYVDGKNIEIHQWAFSDGSTTNIIGLSTGEDQVTKFEDATEQQGKIAKENIISYIKEKYGVEVTKDQITDGKWFGSMTEVKDFGDYVVIGYKPAGGAFLKIERSMTKYEQQGKDLIIYDNALALSAESGSIGYATYINFDGDDIKRFSTGSTGDLVDEKNTVVTQEDITKFVNDSLKNGTAGSYKHTFTLGSDNTYHWVSSEKVN